MTNFFIGLLLVIHFLVGIFLVLIVLMQRTKEGGMGAAFGAGVTESLFGASSGNVLTKITVWTAAIFFATSLSMAVIFSHRGGTTIGAGTLGQTPKAPVTPAITDPTPQGTGTIPTPVNGATLTPPNELPKDGDAPQNPAPAPAPPPEGAAPPVQPPQEPPAAPSPMPQPESPKVSP